MSPKALEKYKDYKVPSDKRVFSSSLEELNNKYALEVIPKLSTLLDTFYVEIVYFHSKCLDLLVLFICAIKSSLSHKIKKT